MPHKLAKQILFGLLHVVAARQKVAAAAAHFLSGAEDFVRVGAIRWKRRHGEDSRGGRQQATAYRDVEEREHVGAAGATRIPKVTQYLGVNRAVLRETILNAVSVKDPV
jgi:hypothetical protein